jgi:hypothetical protein
MHPGHPPQRFGSQISAGQVHLGVVDIRLSISAPCFFFFFFLDSEDLECFAWVSILRKPLPEDGAPFTVREQHT